MTVQELLDTMPACDLVEIVVRKTGHGQWIQGYRIGKEAKVYPAEVTAEIRELKGLNEYKSPPVYLEKDEIIDCKVGFNLPMKVICKDCHKLPEHIGKLEVCSVLPRHVPYFHKNALTHNDFALDINCYPDGFIPEKYIVAKETAQISSLEGQMSIEDFYGSEVIE